MTQWSGKTKGTLLGYKIFLYSIKILGLKSAYGILRFVSWYYYVFAAKSRKSIMDFYKQGLQITGKKAKELTKRNFYVFGQTLLDRNAFLLGKAKHITWSFINEKYLLEAKEKGKGAVIISAHIGNWEIAGNFLKERVTAKINALMLDAEAEKIKKFLKESTGGSKFKIIPIKNDFSHIIKINNALENNEFIAIHADRYTSGSKFLQLNFLGKPIKLPYGPFLIAFKFKVPVFFAFAVKEGDSHYNLLAYRAPENPASVEQIAEAYIKELEKQVKQHPEQWFNYYNYFEV